METSVNNKCKAFTSLEQSRKLAEILPLESADMSWVSCDNGNEKYFRAENRRIILNYEKKHWIPCWSLTALLSVLPEKYTELIKEGGVYRIIIKDSYMTSLFDNPVDACYEMILKLNELKLL